MVEKVQAGEKLPKGWKWFSLGKICEFRNGINFTSSQKGRGLLTVDVLNMYSDSLHISMADLYRVDVSSKNENLLQKNDILFVRSSVKQEGVGWATLFPGYSEQVSFCGFLIRARLTTKEIDPSFLIYYLRSDSVRNWIISRSTRGTITNISQDGLQALSIPVPPISEQKRIVGILNDRLTAIDKAHTATETQLKAAKALPAAYLRQVFDSAEAQKWKIKRLGDVLEDIVAGKSLKCDERPARLDEWGVLKVSAVSWGKFKPEQNKVLPEYFIPLSEHEVKAGDLLISRANTTELVGAVVLVEEGTRSLLMLSDKTLRLIPTTQADKGYLELALRERMAREYIEEHGTGTSDSMKNISQETIRNIPILLPPISKQIEIAEAQGKRQPEIERVIQILQSQLNTINQLPAATLRQAFNGEL